MDAALYREVENMVDAKLAAAMLPILHAQEENKQRLIGIDGNGTGRKGALQRQDDKMEEMAGHITEVKEDVTEVKGNVVELLERSQSWNKKNVWELAKWIIGGIGAFGTVVAGMYIGHLEGWIH